MDGRLLAEAELEGVEVCAVFRVSGGKVQSVEVFLSDPRLLHALGVV